MKTLIFILALVAPTPAFAQVAYGEVKITYRGDYVVGADYDVHIQQAGDVVSRTRYRLAPDWKQGEPARFVAITQSIRSERCPAARTALEKLPDLELPKMRLLPQYTADGRVIIPPYQTHVGRYVLESPTETAGGGLKVAGIISDPVGVWIEATMAAIEPCWDMNPPAGLSQ